MRSTFTISILLGFSVLLYSQSTDISPNGIFISMSTVGDDPLNPRNFNRKDWRFPSFEIAYLRRNPKGQIHQIGIYGLYFLEDVLSIAQLKEWGFGIRYGWNFEVIKLSPRIFLNLTPTVLIHNRYSKYIPFNSTNNFPVEEGLVEAITGVTPSIKLKTKGSAYFHFGFPISFFAFSREALKLKDPTLTKRQQESVGFSFDLLTFSRTEIEFGIGWFFE